MSYVSPVGQSDYAVMDRPLAGAGGGQSSGAGWPGGAFESVPYSPFAHPFAGWVALSDLIADSNPELSDAMRAMAAVLQAAAEQSTMNVFPQIRSALAETGIPLAAIADVERAFLSDLLPLSVGDLTELGAEAFTELVDSGTMEPTEPSNTGFIASVIHYGGHSLLGLEMREVESPPRLPVRYDNLPEGFGDYFLPATPLRVTASLDLPPVASGRNFSIWCRKPIHRRGDNLLATEHTYVDRDISGLTNPRFRGEAVTEQYRADVDEWLPADFTESIDTARPIDQYYYVYELSDPKRARAAKKLRQILERNGIEIQQLIKTSSDTAVTLAVGAATSAGVPLATLSPVLRPISRMIWGGILSRLERSLADTNLTPWTITHTTLYLPEYPVGPLSMFTLLSPAAPTAKLHRIRRDNVDPNRSIMDIGYEEKKRAFQRGRGMMGLSEPPEHPCPADLWMNVSSVNQPAAWTEPADDRAGFRVLVPHAEAGDEACYVSALRADVLEAGLR
jgi:hypothetical protein